MKLEINNIDELLVIDAALNQILEGITISRLSLENLVDNTGNYGFPDYDQETIERLKEEIKNADKTLLITNALLKKCEVLMESETPRGKDKIEPPKW